LPPTFPAVQITLWETPPPLHPHRLRCALLSPAYRVPLAVSAQQFSAVADRLLSLQAVMSHRLL